MSHLNQFIKATISQSQCNLICVVYDVSWRHCFTDLRESETGTGVSPQPTAQDVLGVIHCLALP